MPRRPGSESVFALVLEFVVVSVISWMRGGAFSSFDCEGGAPASAGKSAAGTRAERGSSLPLLVILGVPMLRESGRPFCVSICCNASSAVEIDH